MSIAPSARKRKRFGESKNLGRPIPEPDFRPSVGQLVRVGFVDQIMSTLDAQGNCNGLPWMEEMLRYCGQSFPVVRWANSVCVFGDTIRFRKLNDCVVLEMPRCCGSSHGACQMACSFFWHTRWLMPADREDTTSVSRNRLQSVPPQFVSLLATNAVDDGGYRCQATQLAKITHPQESVSRRLADEHNLNRIGVSQFAADFCSTLLAKATRTQAGLSGPCVGRTPVQNLNLQPGDVVRVLSKSAIRETLNADGKNRGLWFDPSMLKYCGQTMRVTRRVTQFINESTGQMVRTSVPSLVLDEEHCSGRARHYCSRLLHFFWREAWLERGET